MKAIVAIDRFWGIGNDGKLLYHIKEDMDFFKKMTIGKVVVMGRKTFESLPNNKPLKDRVNLIITSGNYENYDNVIFGNIDVINEEIKKYDTNDIFIIGGETIYKQFIHRCDTVYTTCNMIIRAADAHMPNLAFEGFTCKQILDSGTSATDGDWNIVEWITSECKPYTSVLWFVDSDNRVVFLYSNYLYHWKGVYSNNNKIITDEFKERLRNIIYDDNRELSCIKIHDYYRIEINSKNDNGTIRLASFGATGADAAQNIMMAIGNLLT